MLVAENRPRTLTWFHAGPLLFGDWGTSRLYVLGLAFYYTGHASLTYLALMSIVMAAVAWAYTIVCRCFPDGGGVYSAARRVHPLLSVIAATLLLCDFIVTAALSAVEGFHYLGVHGKYVVAASIGAIGVLGVVNWLGARAAGRFALLIAVVAIALSGTIGALCIPLLPKGLETATVHADGIDDPWKAWLSVVRIVLALSGIEAVASMSGLMKQPVEKTAKRTIWPVLIEVLLLNFIFCIALNALPGRAETTKPDYYVYEQGHNTLGPNGTAIQFGGDLKPPEGASPEIEAKLAEIKEYRSTPIKMLAEYTATRAMGETPGRVFGMIAGGVFGLLLLSAVNTAILAMVSVCYALAQDRELPRSVTRLNYSGVPAVGLVLSCVLPAVVLLIVSDDKALSELYAIGVVGAIAINVVCCAWNKELPIKPWERRCLWVLGGVMTAIELTIIVAKPNATLFAAIVIGSVLAARFVVRQRAPIIPVPTPEAGWLAELNAPAAKLDASRPRIMLAARGQDQAEFAVDLARRRGAALFAMYVRTVRLLDVQPGQLPRVEDDPEAQKALGTVAVLAKQAGVPFFPIYVTSSQISDEILDYTATFACDTVIMGKSRRGLFARAIEGDVVVKVAANLPDEIALITRSSRVTAQELQHGGEASTKSGGSASDDDDVSSPS